MNKLRTFSAITFTLLFYSCASVNVFENVQLSDDETYGYSPENPIRTGYWDRSKNIQANIYFISRLVTEDNQKLNWIKHASVDSPYDNSKKIIPHRFGPMAGISKIGGLLDAYTLVTEVTNDTLVLYFDIYTKAPIMAPKGLKFISQ